MSSILFFIRQLLFLLDFIRFTHLTSLTLNNFYQVSSHWRTSRLLKAKIVGEEVTHLPEQVTEFDNISKLVWTFNFRKMQSVIWRTLKFYMTVKSTCLQTIWQTWLLIVRDESTSESFDRLTNLTYLVVKPNPNFSDCFSRLVKLSELMILIPVIFLTSWITCQVKFIC